MGTSSSWEVPEGHHPPAGLCSRLIRPLEKGSMVSERPAAKRATVELEMRGYVGDPHPRVAGVGSDEIWKA